MNCELYHDNFQNHEIVESEGRIMSCQKMCLLCVNADLERKNSLAQICCNRFDTFVDLFSYCDYFLPKNQLGIFERIENNDNQNSN